MGAAPLFLMPNDSQIHFTPFDPTLRRGKTASELKDIASGGYGVAAADDLAGGGRAGRGGWVGVIEMDEDDLGTRRLGEVLEVVHGLRDEWVRDLAHGTSGDLAFSKKCPVDVGAVHSGKDVL